MFRVEQPGRTLRASGLTRAIRGATVGLVLVLSGCYTGAGGPPVPLTAAPTTVPTEPSAPSASPSSMATQSSPEPSPTFLGNAQPTPSAQLTEGATWASAPKATLDPADWQGPTGWTAQGPIDPIAPGGTERYEIFGLPAGPTCSIAVRYPSGTSQGGLASHTFTAPGAWLWTWIVPSSAGYGTATLVNTCTYAGFPKSSGPITFKIIAPPATPSPTPIPTPIPTPSPIDHPPTTPTGLTAVAKGCNEIDLSWTASTDTDATPVKDYVVWKNDVVFAVKTSTSAVDWNVWPGGGPWSYYVAAEDTLPQLGGHSETVTIPNTPPCPTPIEYPPTAPTGVAVTPVSCTEMHVTWNASTDTDATPVQLYWVYRNGTQLGWSATTSFADIGGMNPGFTYSWYVIAQDTAMQFSAHSASVSATVPAC